MTEIKYSSWAKTMDLRIRSREWNCLHAEESTACGVHAGASEQTIGFIFSWYKALKGVLYAKRARVLGRLALRGSQKGVVGIV